MCRRKQVEHAEAVWPAALLDWNYLPLRPVINAYGVVFALTIDDQDRAIVVTGCFVRCLRVTIMVIEQRHRSSWKAGSTCLDDPCVLYVPIEIPTKASGQRALLQPITRCSRNSRFDALRNATSVLSRVIAARRQLPDKFNQILSQ